ncbi:MAG: ABC transporter substrate-binding protein [Pseudomonadota bacterium]
MSAKIELSKREFVSLMLGLPAATFLPHIAGAQGADTLNIAFMADLQSWDPTAVTFPVGQSIFKCVYDSPLHWSSDQKLQPRQIAQRKWLDDNSTRLQINLRDDIFFHDGSKLTTEDVKYSWLTRKQDKRLAIAGMLQDLIDVEIKSPTEAVLVYSKPSPSAEFYLGFLGVYILPKAYHEKVGDEGFLAKPVGAGPYKLVDYQRGSRIVLEAFDKYWGGVPAIKSVTFQILPEASTRVAAIESGRVDVAVQLPFREAVRLQSKPDLSVSLFPQAEIYMMQIPSYVDTYQNKDVRLALHMAIDKAALAKAFFNNLAKPLQVLATPGSSGDVPGYTFPFDRKKAAELLAKAGYSKAKPLQMTLVTTNGTFPNDYEIAQAIAQMWRQIGADVKIEEITIAKYMELNHAAKLPGIMLYSWANATGDPENYSGRILNPALRFSAWKEPANGERIAKLFAMKLGEERLAEYRALNKDASENTWSIPLLQPVANIVTKKTVSMPTYSQGYVLPAEAKRTA